MRTGRATTNRSRGKARHNLRVSHSYLLWLMGPLVTLTKSRTYDMSHSISRGHVPTELRDLGFKKKKKIPCCSPWRRTENFRSEEPSVSLVPQQEVQQRGVLGIHRETRGAAPAVTQSCSDWCQKVRCPKKGEEGQTDTEIVTGSTGFEEEVTVMINSKRYAFLL